MRHLFTLLFLSLLAVGCATSSPKVSQPNLPPVAVKPSPAEPVEVGHIPLNWENTNVPHPERAPWSSATLKVVDQDLEKFEKATDLKGVCPKFHYLDREGKKFAIATLIVAVVYYESGYSPVSRMWEKKLEGKAYPIDPITGKYVYSEGLLQLSYQDMQWAKFCKFDWSKDKLLKDTDPTKTILDPILNLECGIQIMANQAESKKLIFPKYGYWAVMNTGSRYSEVSNIKARVKKYAPQCFN